MEAAENPHRPDDRGPRNGRAVALSAAGAAVAGLALYFTAPPSLLIDLPAYPLSEDEFFGTQSVELSEFYEVDEWPSAPPGTLARAEAIDEAPDGIRAWRIMYHSTDLQGNDIPVTGIFMVPDAPVPPGGFSLVSFAHGTLGVAQVCGISQTPFTPGTPANTAQAAHLTPMVEHGWAVIGSDYSGMGAPGPNSYLVGPLEARGVLDGMRAVIEADDRIGSIPINTERLGLYGKSQGGEVVISAAELAPTYSPELELKGSASLAPGFVPAIPGAIDLVASNPTSTSQNFFTLLLISSFAENYPEDTSLDALLSETGKERLPLVNEFCGAALSDKVSDVALNELVNLPIDRGYVRAVAKATPGETPTDIPFLVLQGLKDVTILPQLTHAQVMARCAIGDSVDYRTYPNDDHPSLNYQARLSEPYALDWLDERFDGVPAPNNCANQRIGLSTGGAR